jgi:hypothetical protein
MVPGFTNFETKQLITKTLKLTKRSGDWVLCLYDPDALHFADFGL